MSIAENPLVGRMKKSMANFTTYTLNGKNIIRSKPFKVRDARTPKQLANRERMARLDEMYDTFKSIIQMGFPERKVELNSQNMFISVNFSYAFETIEKEPVLRYPLLLLSQGSLPKVKVIDSVILNEGIAIRYDKKSVYPDVDATDEIVACARLITGELLIARQFIGYNDIGTILLKHPDLQAEDVMCCYVFVRSGDRKKSSSSVYVEL